MSRESSLVKNTIILGFGTFLPTLVSLITTPILTGKLTNTEYGTFDLINTLVSLLLPVVTLQIQAAGFRFIIAERSNKERCKIIISNITAVTIPAIIISGVLLAIILRSQDSLLVALMVIYFGIDIINNTLSQIARGFANNKIYSIATIAQSITKMIFIVLVLEMFSWGLNGVLTALVAGTIVSVLLLAFTLKIWDYIRFKYISGQTIKELLGYSWPMVPNSLSGWLLRLSNRLVITFFLGVEANAIYAVANKIPNLLTTVNGTFSMAWQENASVSANDDDVCSYYSKMYDTFWNLIAGSCAVLIAATPVLFCILIRGDYKAAYYQMPILFIGILYSCLSSFLGGIYVANKRTKNVGVTTVLAAISNVVIDLLTVNIIGITAGSVSTLVSYMLLTIYRMWDLQKFQPIKYRVKKIIIINIYLIIMSILCFIDNLTVNLINIPLGIIIAVYLNKDLLKVIIEKLRKILKRN